MRDTTRRGSVDKTRRPNQFAPCNCIQKWQVLTPSDFCVLRMTGNWLCNETESTNSPTNAVQPTPCSSRLALTSSVRLSSDSLQSTNPVEQKAYYCRIRPVLSAQKLRVLFSNHGIVFMLTMLQRSKYLVDLIDITVLCWNWSQPCYMYVPMSFTYLCWSYRRRTSHSAHDPNIVTHTLRRCAPWVEN